MKIFLLLALALVASINSGLTAEGVMVTRQSQSHPEGGSIAAEYSSYKRVDNNYTIHLSNGSVLRRTDFQPTEIFPYLKLERVNKIDDTIKETLNERIGVYKNAIERYPKSTPFLRREVAHLEEIVSQLNNGNSWYNQKWVPSRDLKQIIEQEDLDSRDQSLAAMDKIKQKSRARALKPLIEAMKQEINKLELTSKALDNDEQALENKFKVSQKELVKKKQELVNSLNALFE